MLGGISPRAVRLGSGKYVNGDCRQSEEGRLTGTGRRYAFTAGMASHSVVYLGDLCALAECQSEACPAVPPTGPGGRRADGPKTGHALTFILDHLNRADQDKKENLTLYLDSNGIFLPYLGEICLRF